MLWLIFVVCSNEPMFIWLSYIVCRYDPTSWLSSVVCSYDHVLLYAAMIPCYDWVLLYAAMIPHYDWVLLYAAMASHVMTYFCYISKKGFGYKWIRDFTLWHKLKKRNSDFIAVVYVVMVSWFITDFCYDESVRYVVIVSCFDRVLLC